MDQPYKTHDSNQIYISRIIETIDNYLIEENKSYATLAIANKVLLENKVFSTNQKTDKMLKGILENGEIPHAYKTEKKPQQWRILLSENAKKEALTKKMPTVSSKITKKARERVVVKCLKCNMHFRIDYLKKNGHLSRKGDYYCPNCFVNMDKLYRSKKETHTDKGITLNFKEWHDDLDQKQKKGFKRLIFMVVATIIILIVTLLPDNRSNLVRSLDQQYIGRQWDDYTHETFNDRFGPGRALYYEDSRWVYYYPKGDFTIKVSKKNNQILEISDGKD